MGALTARLITKGDRYRFELLALRLDVDGPTAATPRMVRTLANTPLWLQVRFLLREHGFTEAEIAQLMSVHPPGCPCWNCVKALHIMVRNHMMKLRRRAKIMGG